jgi:hypothetical protein
MPIILGHAKAKIVHIPKPALRLRMTLHRRPYPFQRFLIIFPNAFPIEIFIAKLKLRLGIARVGFNTQRA